MQEFYPTYFIQADTVIKKNLGRVMLFDRQLNREMLLATEVVQLRQICFTPARVFQPGLYIAGDLPNVAFEMGLVDRLPPVRGKNAEIRYAENALNDESTSGAEDNL